MLTWATVALFAWRLAFRSLPRLVPVAAAVGACGLIVVTYTAADRSMQSYAEFRNLGPTILELSTAARHALDGRDQVVIDRTGDYLHEGAVQAGLMADLDRHGVTVLIPSPRLGAGRQTRRDPLQFPPDRVVYNERGKTVMLVSGREALLDPPGRLLASSDPLTTAQTDDWLEAYENVKQVLDENGASRLDSALTSPHVALSLFKGPARLSSVRPEIARLGELNRRGSAHLLWLTHDDPGS